MAVFYVDGYYVLHAYFKWVKLKNNHADLNAPTKHSSQKRWPQNVCTGFLIAVRQIEQVCPGEGSSTNTKSYPPKGSSSKYCSSCTGASSGSIVETKTKSG